VGFGGAAPDGSASYARRCVSGKSLKRRLVCAIHALLLLTYVLAISARYIPPEVFWPVQLIGVALPFLSLGLVVGAAHALLGGSTLLRFGYAVLILVMLYRLGLPLPDTAVSEGRHEIAVFTFNGKPTYDPEVESAALTELVATDRPHIIAYQQVEIRQNRPETGLVVDERYVAPLLSLGYTIPSGHPTAERGPIQVPILSRIDWSGYEDVDLSIHREHPDALVRYSRAVFVWDSRTIVVYNVHLHSFGGERPWRGGISGSLLSPRAWLRALRSLGDDYRTRASQARALKEVLARERYPFILVGDFNSTPHNWEYYHVASSFRDVYQRARLIGWGATYHARLPLVRIDHIIASEHWEVVDARVLRRPRSDHFPVIARLALRPGVAEDHDGSRPRR
jgi:endonuclease/exonuclease/phosphatase family metal-dependent hydrolase